MNDEIWGNMTPEESARMNDRFASIHGDPKSCPSIILLIGLPASGKSTWTTNYMSSAVHPTVTLSTDQQIEDYAMANGLTYEQAFPKIDSKVLEQNMDAALRVAASRKEDIIIDRTNMRLKVRRRWLGQVPKHYVKIGLVFEIPPATLIERLDRRAKLTGKFIPLKVIEEMRGFYQPPVVEEFDTIQRVVQEA